MTDKNLMILLIIEQCNPEGFSEPLVGYNFYNYISKIVDVTLVTHERNKKALEKKENNQKIFYIRESLLSQKLYKLAANLTSSKKGINWPLRKALTYPIYAEFDHQVYQKFKGKILKKEYDIVHVLTPILPRYPSKVVNACKNTPFLIGPVNGGVPFPSGFEEISKQESAHFNFLRAIGRAVIPGYLKTYKKADKILVGSTYTANLLKKIFNLPDHKFISFYENGISKEFLEVAINPQAEDIINLLFVGRLVPYKGCNFLIDSVNQLSHEIKNKICLTIVGDGSERKKLEEKVNIYKLNNIVKFTGWVNQKDTLKYYCEANIFCFPSIREFGGAVVLEAMACGLPCIVINNGGISEYVTNDTGFKIEPTSKEYVIQELTKYITALVRNHNLRRRMSMNSKERAKEFEWSEKANKIVNIYQEMIVSKKKIKKQ